MRQRPALDEKKIPQEDTIRRNLPLIYEELLGKNLGEINPPIFYFPPR
jgi:hypothetical protein